MSFPLSFRDEKLAALKIFICLLKYTKCRYKMLRQAYSKTALPKPTLFFSFKQCNKIPLFLKQGGSVALLWTTLWLHKCCYCSKRTPSNNKWTVTHFSVWYHSFDLSTFTSLHHFMHLLRMVRCMLRLFTLKLKQVQAHVCWKLQNNQMCMVRYTWNST